MTETLKNLKPGITLKRNGHTLKILEVWKGFDGFVKYIKDGKEFLIDDWEFEYLYLN